MTEIHWNPPTGHAITCRCSGCAEWVEQCKRDGQDRA